MRRYFLSYHLKLRRHMIKQLLATILLTSSACSASSVLANESYETPIETQEIQTNNDYTKLPVGLIFDKNLSAHVGASGFLTLLSGYQALDNHFLPDTRGDKSAYTMLGRFGKLVLEDVLFSTAMIAQHEVFGHGARAREFHLKMVKYNVRPYKGYVSYLIADYNKLSPSEKITFVTGGMEGTGVLAKRVRDSWLETNTIDERQAHMYFLNITDQTSYILNNRHEKTFNTDGNDVSAYIRELNAWHGNQVMDKNKLHKKALIDIFDPYLFYSIYGMGLYIFEGTQNWEYPMIPIGDYKYLPGMRLALAPYGPEYQLINYIRSPERSIQATFRRGKTGIRRSLGTTIEMTRLVSSEYFNVDAKFDLWRQPRLFTSSAQNAHHKLGGGLALLARYKMFNCAELVGQLGYKTSGYAPGDPLKRGPYLRAGFNVHI
jgi:hypothetical protein